MITFWPIDLAENLSLSPPPLLPLLVIASHNKTLIPETSDLNERNFLIRNLYKDCY